MIRSAAQYPPAMCLAVAVMLCSGGAAVAQMRDNPASAQKDTLKTPAAARDTLAPVRSPSGIDSVVTYSASDSIVYSLRSRTMYMFGKGNIRYKELALMAEQIDINWNTSILNAVGVRDTADTTGKKFRGQPDLIDGGEKYHGSKVVYFPSPTKSTSVSTLLISSP